MGSVYGQNKEAIKLYNQAILDKGVNKIETAVASLQKSIAIDPQYSLAKFELGKLYLAQKRYKDAISPLLSIVQQDSTFTPLVIDFLGDAYFGSEDYPNARLYFKKFLTDPRVNPITSNYTQVKLANCDFVMNTKTAHAVAFKNIGPAVNTAGEEYFPATIANEKKLYFTKRNGTTLRDDENIYVASYEKDTWGMAAPVEGPINTPDNEGAHTISPSGKYLIFTACNRKNQFVQTNSCDLYISKKMGDQWGTPNLMASTINTTAWESQPTISADGKTIYFTSNRPGGYGGLDIWYCELDDKGQFGKAYNLGPQINTPFDEEKPFMHPDGRTFYFVSNGRGGYGKKDIYLTKKFNDIWLSPMNIGKPFNSAEDEFGIFVNAKGNKGYIASNRAEGFGGLDIYTFEMPDAIKPLPTCFISGKVTDQSDQPKAAKGAIIDYESNQLIYTFSTDSISGEYLATLPAGKVYFINVSKEGYLFESEKIDLKSSAAKEINRPIHLKAIAKGTTLALKNTYFETDKFDLKPESFSELDRLIEFMNNNPTVHIEVAGHTDNTGDAAKNKILSQQRAESVTSYLIKKGIEMNRLKATGYGSEKSIIDNNTPEGKAMNRRTEIIIH